MKLPLFLGLLLGFSHITRAADVDNPAYKAWAAYKVGTTFTTNAVTTAKGEKSETKQVHALLEKTADKIVVEITTTIPVGKSTYDSKHKAEHPKTLKGDAPKPEDTGKQKETFVAKGEETLKLAGKEYKTTWTTTKITNPGAETVVKRWTCPDAPIELLKMETKTTGSYPSTSTMELTEIKEPK